MFIYYLAYDNINMIKFYANMNVNLSLQQNERHGFIMNFHILTLFPEMIMQSLGTSITGRAIDKGLISVNAINIRDFSDDKHKK